MNEDEEMFSDMLWHNAYFRDAMLSLLNREGYNVLYDTPKVTLADLKPFIQEDDVRGLRRLLKKVGQVDLEIDDLWELAYRSKAVKCFRVITLLISEAPTGIYTKAISQKNWDTLRALLSAPKAYPTGVLDTLSTMAVNGTYKDVLQVFDLRKPTQDVLNRVCLAAASSKVAGCLPAIFGYVEGLNLGRAFMSMTADTALQVALKEKQEHNLKFLLDKGAWADETLNLAELALRQGYNNYVQKFLDRGVSPQEYLELAIKVAADDSIVGVLLEKGAYPCDVAIFAAIEDLPDYLGKLMSLRPPSDPMPISAVNHAIMQNSAYTLSIVLGLGGVIRDGDLQAAVLRKSEDMVKVLLDHNADVHGVDISSSGVVIKRMFEARYRTVWDHLEDW